MIRFLHPLFLSLLLCGLTACGGGGGGSGTDTTLANEMDMRVESWLGRQSFNNQGFVSVQICVSGSTRCQTIDHLLVDTGSYGLRVLSSEVSLALSPQSSQGKNLAECAQFISGYTWGGIYIADIGLGNQTASAVPVQLIDPNFSQLPASCSNSGGNAMNDVGSLGAKGILGIGSFQQDCPGCAFDNSPGHYYACDNISCSPTTVALSSQVVNPVAMLPSNNNGVIINLPAVSSGGQAGITGKLILGINTSSNNTLTTQSVFRLDDGGYLVTAYGGNEFTQSYIDSGSNGIFFTDPTIPLCVYSIGFYCPPIELQKTATIMGYMHTPSAVLNFRVGNTDASDNSLAVAPNLAGTGELNSFVWGLPFFYGRKVFVSIAGKPVLGNVSPIIAF